MGGKAQDLGWEGLILQRGNQKLPLCKLTDRLTVRLLDPNSKAIAQLNLQLDLRLHDWIESAQLFILQVDPTQLEPVMESLRADAAIAFVSHAYALASQPDAVFYLTDQITLQFAEGTDANRMQAIASEASLQILKLVSGAAKTFVFQLMPSAIANPLKLANHLIALPEVWLAEPNIAVPTVSPLSLARRRPPADPQTIAAWQITQGDRAVAIAVVNSHLDLNHPVFWGEGKIVAPYQPEHFQPAAFVPLLPIEVAPNCALMPICPDRYLDDQALERMCEWMTVQGADVVYWDIQGDFLISLRQRMAIAKVALGCVMVADAIGLRHPDIIGVASDLSRLDDCPAGISLVAAGEKAGVIAAGAAALILSVNPDLTAIEIRQILQATADKIQPKDNQADKNQADKKQADYDAIGYSQQFGYGKVNAFKAVDAARKRRVRLPLVAEWLEFHQPTPSIQVADERQVLDLEVSLSLNHAFMGDLEIWLRLPNDRVILLQNRGLGRLERLSKTYSMDTVPLLRQAIAQPARGVWQLEIIDRASAHLDSLEHWTLRLGV
jgi:Proprotein convertase P-domain